MNIIEIERVLSGHRRLFDAPILLLDERVDSVRLKVLKMALAGERIPDMVSLSLYCLHCKTSNPRFRTMVLENFTFARVYELFAKALNLAKSSFQEQQPVRCENCSRLAIWLWDHHHFESSWKKDIVVRISRDGDSESLCYQLFWMFADGQTRLTTSQEIPELSSLRFESIYAEASKCLSNGSLELACTTIKDILRIFPEKRELLRLGFQLIDTTKRGLAEAIAENYIVHYPSEAGGYALLAQLFVKAFVASNATEPALLHEAKSHARKALDFEPDDSGALLAWCNCLRLEPIADYDRVVTEAFRDLLQRYPEYAEAYYNYGLHCLLRRPEEALRFFEHGSTLKPEDVDFVIGKARALVEMSMFSEAQKALLQAQRMFPGHFRIKELLESVNRNLWSNSGQTSLKSVH